MSINKNPVCSTHTVLPSIVKIKNKNIKPNYINVTKKFGGKNSLDPREYYEIMGNTVFSLVSHGYYHPETYRLYESLESGCIPIIENPHNFFDIFLPKNPLIKINLWKESTVIIEDLNLNFLLKKTNPCCSIVSHLLSLAAIGTCSPVSN